MLQSIFIDIERLVRKKISPKLANIRSLGFLKDVLSKKAGKVDRYLKCSPCSPLSHRIINDFHFFFVCLIFIF